MAKKNITVLDILTQVQARETEILSGLSQINNSESLANIEIESPEIRAIFDDISKKENEIAKHLGEINQKFNR